MSNGRKARGMRTQAAIAQRWRDIGLFPYATDQGPGRSGNDLINTPRLKVEIKARQEQGVSLPASLRQAESAPGKGTPILIWRHNGQGEMNMDRWTVSMNLADFERIWAAARNWERHEERERIWKDARGWEDERDG